MVECLLSKRVALSTTTTTTTKKKKERKKERKKEERENTISGSLVIHSQPLVSFPPLPVPLCQSSPVCPHIPSLPFSCFASYHRALIPEGAQAPRLLAGISQWRHQLKA
jgi:hypothetical protein